MGSTQQQEGSQYCYTKHRGTLKIKCWTREVRHKRAGWFHLYETLVKTCLIYSDRQQISACPGQDRCQGRGIRKPYEVRSVFCILIVLVVTLVKMCQNSWNCTLKMCKLYLNQSYLKKQPNYLLSSPTTDSGTWYILMPASMASHHAVYMNVELHWRVE